MLNDKHHQYDVTGIIYFQSYCAQICITKKDIKMKNVIKIIISNVCIVLFILHPNCVNKKSNAAQPNVHQNTISLSTNQARPAKGFTDSDLDSKIKTLISAELIVLSNHSKPKKKRPAYMYC